MVQQAMVAENHNLTLFHDQSSGLEYASDIGETTPVSWQPRGALTFEEWIAIGNTLQQVNASLNWWVGDWLNYGERKWGEMYAQVETTLGREYQTLANAKWITSRIHFSLRREKLSWSHHKEVAALDPDDQAKWLERAEAEGWSVRRLREEIKGPQLPKLTVSFAEPTEAPFNHRTRVGIPESERTAVDEYEQQADEYRQDEYVNVEDQFGHVETIQVQYAEQPEQLYTNGNHKLSVHFSSDTPEHYTPKEIIEATIECLGVIDLDPCSNSKSDPNVLAGKHYTQEDDGLTQEWHGRIYMNPPYGREIGKWVYKLCQEYEAGRVTEAIALVPARTDTDWFDQLIDGHKFHCFVHGRLTFIGNNESAPFPSAIVYFGPHLDAFYYSFRPFGRIVQETNPDMFGA